MTTRTKALLVFGAVGAAALAYACTLTDITGVPVGQVTIQPPSVTLIEGATLQLQAQAKDQLNEPLPVGAIVWAINGPPIVSISPNGLVQALEAGQTNVTATLEGVSASAPVTVTPGPTIGASPSSLSYLGGVGASPPPAQTVEITNSGGGTLSGLTASVSYGAGASGWLNVAISGTTAPASLTVSVQSGGLSQGTYTATVSITSSVARNSPVTIPVELLLTLDQPVIQVEPATLTFDAVQGSGPPAPKLVQITNAGGGTLTNLQALVTPGSWLSANLSSTTAPTQLSVQPNPASLSVGVYQETVLVRSAGALNEKEIGVTLTVAPAPKADVSVTKTGPVGGSVGDTLLFILSVSNAGPDPASEVILLDSLPSGLSFERASAGGAASGRAVTWNLGTVASGATSVDSLWALATGQGTLTNVARVSTTAEDPQPANGRDTHDVQIVPVAANLLVQKTGPATAGIGETIQYLVRVVNGGPNKAENVVLTDSLPTGATYVESNPAGSRNGSVLTWALGTLDPGGEFSSTITLEASSSGILTNVVKAASSTLDPVTSNNRAVVTTAIDVQADLSVTKTGPAQAEAGDTITYEITVANDGPDEAQNTTVLDSLPEGVAFVSATGNGIQVSQGFVSWEIPSIAAGSSGLVTVSVRVDSTGVLNNVAVAIPAATDPDTDDLRGTHTTTVIGADLQVQKTATDDGTPALGENVTYTVTVDNLGPNDATGVVVTDTLPAGVTFVSTSQGTYIPGEGPNGVVTWNAGDLAEADAPISMDVVVTLASSGTLTNTAAVTSATGDPRLGNNTATASTTPGASADLSIAKIATDDGTPVVGEQVVYTLTVSNAGPSEATGVAVRDTLPTGVTFDSASASGGIVGQVVGWPSIPTLAAGADTTLTVWVTIGQPGTFTNKATVGSSIGDPVPGNNLATAGTTADPAADVSITKSAADDGTPVVGEQITYTITITNNGPNPALGVVVTDTLPGGVSFVSATGGGSHSAGVVSWSAIPTLAMGADTTFTVVVTITSTGALTNTAAAVASTFDPSPGNNTATAVTAPGASADLQVEKTGPASVTAGTQAAYTITVTNNGPTTATDVVVRDTIPVGTSFASATGSPTVNGREVRWPTIASLANGGSQAFTLTLNVASSTTGTITNVARAGAVTSDPAPANNRATLESSVATSADLAVTKVVGGPVTAGSQAIYTITVTNNGPSDASAVVLTDTLPTGMNYVSAVPAPAAQSGQGVTWAPLTTLAAGSNQTYSLTVAVDPGVTGDLTNMAKILSSGTSDPTPDNNRVTPLTSVQVSADVALAKAGPNSAVPGTQITYNFTADNLGPSDATGLVVTDPIPVGVTFVSATGGGLWNSVSNSVTWNLGDLNSAATPVAFSLTVQIDAGTTGSLTNTATLKSTTFDPNTLNNIASKTTSVTGANVFVTKSAPATASQGQQIAYTVTVENGGPSTATGVRIQDSIPVGVTYNSDTGGGTYNNGQRTLTWNVGTLLKDASQTYTVYVTVGATTVGDVTNAVAVTEVTTTDPNPGDNWDSATTTILPNPPSGLSATTVSQTRIDLAWTDNSNNETGFRVERSPAGAGTWISVTTTAANATAYSNTGLTANTAYDYRVVAVNAGGDSNPSNTASATTLPNPPPAPSDLNATTVSQTRIDLAWTDNATTETGYRVERSPDGATGWTEIATLGADAAAYSNTGLTANTTYYYRVFATNTGGDSGASNIANATTLPNPPVAPTGLSATPASQTQIDLAWTDNSSDETGFRIERRLSAGGGWAAVTTTAVNATAYSDTGLTANTAYDYRVIAVNTGGESGPSNTASATTLPNPPAAPTGLGATTVSQTQIDLAWTDNATTETGYRVERSPNGTTGWTEVAALGADVTTYSNTGLTANTTYYYRVFATNTGGDSSPSNIANATTLPNPPVAPTGLSATPASQTQIDLAWTDNATTETGYRVERSPDGTTGWTEVAALGADVTVYSNTGLTANTTHYYRVFATNAGGDSGASNIANATTLPDPPVAPTGLSATPASQTQIDLAWTDNATTETGYRVERSPDGTTGWTEVATLAADITAYSNTGLTANTTYYYRVFAINTGGDSSPSNTANATTLPNPPTAPTGLSATPASQTQIDLAWTDNATTETGYRVERSPDGTTGWAEIATLAADVTTYSNTGLTASTTHYYRVFATNAGGDSSPSNTANATTLPNLPAAPTGLSATPASQTQIDLAWTDNSSDETGFRIERRLSAGGGWVQVTTTAANATAYSDTGLTANTSYDYRVIAVNAAGASGPSNTASATTLPNPPAAPTGLGLTVISPNQVDLAWTDNATTETGYRVERCAGTGCSSFAPLTTLGADATSHSDATATEGTTYRYRVFATNAGGSSGSSNEEEVTTPLVAPSTLEVTGTTASSVSLSWADNSGAEDNYQVERCTGTACSNFTLLTTLGADAVGHTDNAVAASTTYRYRVRATATGGITSGYSNEVEAKTGTLPPVAPTGLALTVVSPNQIDLTWTDNATTESGYRIERCVGSGCSTFALLTVLSADATSHNDGTVLEGTTYRYQVIATNAGGSSDPSNQEEATTPLVAPTLLAVTGTTASSVSLSWADNSGAENNYEVERCTNSGCSSFALLATLGPSATTHTDNTVAASTTYRYRVRATATGGITSAYSSAVEATTSIPPPPAPTGLTPVAGTNPSTEIDLGWTASAGATDYKVERCAGLGSGCTPDTQIASTTTGSTSYGDSGLTPSTQYCYHVIATNAGGDSSPSSPPACLTTGPPPSAPVQTPPPPPYDP